jgi:hypothetical protein
MGWEAATAAERERCAKVCEAVADGNILDPESDFGNGWVAGAMECLEDIRAGTP